MLLVIAAAKRACDSRAASIASFSRTIPGPLERRTRNPVQLLMENWVTGGTSSGGDIQEAICVWYNGSRILPLDHLNARDRFDDWRREMDLHRKIGSWEITAMDAVAGSEPPAMIVSIDIDGKPYRMHVTADQPIEWVR